MLNLTVISFIALFLTNYVIKQFMILILDPTTDSIAIATHPFKDNSVLINSYKQYSVI